MAKDDKNWKDTSATIVDDTTTSPDTPVKEDSYEIRINSYKVTGIGGVIAVHNEIAFYSNGEPIIALNGNAHNNQTGELNTFALSPGNTLRVSASPKTYGQAGMEQVGSVVLASDVPREEMFEKLKTATAASQYINNSKIDYVVVGGVNFEAQNSNSAATTIIQAMGYKYPQSELSGFWVPGAKRDMLPNNWMPTLNDDDFEKALSGIERDAVVRQVKKEKSEVSRTNAEESNFPNLHDPNKQALSEGTANADAAQEKAGFTSAAENPITAKQNLADNFQKVADQTQEQHANTETQPTPSPTQQPAMSI